MKLPLSLCETPGEKNLLVNDDENEIRWCSDVDSMPLFKMDRRGKQFCD